VHQTELNITMTIDQRICEVARILAAGIVRLHERGALLARSDGPSASEKPGNSAQDCLELCTTTVLSVHTG
jgi:hypothetical protein